MVLLLDTHLFYDDGLQGGAQLGSDALLQQVICATPCSHARILCVMGGATMRAGADTVLLGCRSFSSWAPIGCCMTTTTWLSSPCMRMHGETITMRQSLFCLSFAGSCLMLDYPIHHPRVRPCGQEVRPPLDCPIVHANCRLGEIHPSSWVSRIPGSPELSPAPAAIPCTCW